MSSQNVGKRPAGAGFPLGRVLAVVAALIVIAIIGSSTFRYAQIDEGERGIIVTQGAVSGIQEPGIFFSPFAPFTKVEVVNVRRQTRQVTQNVASSDKQLYDIDIQVDYSRKTDPESLRAQYGDIGVSDDQLNQFLDGFINDALKSASTQFTLDQVLSDRGTFTQRISELLRNGSNGQPAPVEQVYVNLEAVKVLDIKVGDAYAALLAEKANLEVQIETEEKRRQQIEAEQSNNLFRAEQEATVSLTREKGLTAAALEEANRESQVRALQGEYYRNNPELLELRKRELMVEMLASGNIWFVDPNTDLTLLLDRAGGTLPSSVIPGVGNNASPEPTPQP